jgi:shikimate kinase
MRNIVLVGFMGTGKTVVAGILAEKLGREFIEIDTLIEKEEGMSVKDIFEKKGELYFRDIEKKIIKRAGEKQGVVISAGGGAIIDRENLGNLKKNSVIICLKASPEVILKRTKGNACRPLLNVPDPKSEIVKLLTKREQYYNKADHLIDTDRMNPEEVATAISKII